MPLSPGQNLNNRYRIVTLLGQGGFGAVYKAWDTNLNGPCAVKENLDTSPAAQSQFAREASILFNLRHPSLPRVSDHFLIPEQGQYLVMDYIEGEDLLEKLKASGSALPSELVLHWIGQVCDALNYMHSRQPPIIHRDIKPSNIKITPEGQAVLVDFGISKIYDPELSTTRGAQGVTPGFSPPEQYGTGHTDERSDVYSLAATLYTLLTGQIPPDAIERVARGATIAPPHLLNPQLSPKLEQAILQAMEIDTQRRLPSVNALQSAIRESISRPTGISPPAGVMTSYAPAVQSPVPSASVPVHLETAVLPAIPLEKPRSINRISILCLVTAGVLLLAGILSLGAAGLGFSLIVTGCLGMVGGVGLRRGRNWGRRLAIFFLSLLVLLSALISVAFFVTILSG